VRGLQSLARANHISISAGIHEPGLLSPRKIRNTSIWIGEEGEILQRYQKLHLFDVEIEGGPKARESEYVPFPFSPITSIHLPFYSLRLRMNRGTKWGKMDTNESIPNSVFEEGPEINPPFQTPVGKVGLQICFDLRYPEPALSLKRQGAQIITYPSAFTVPTGEAHWELLLRGRAVETQSYGKEFLCFL
jgi:predicted amidohydrolase